MKALVTGASSGIGRDIAEKLNKMGFSLILVARSVDKLNKLNEKLGGKHTVIGCDLSDKNEVVKLYEKVKHMDIEYLINNAGFGIFGEFTQTELTDELNMIDVNICAMHILMKLFLKDFTKRNKGTVLNVASSAAYLPGPLLSSYYATKAYILRLSLAAAEELRRNGSAVKISVLCPGPVKTDFDNRAGVSFSLKGLESEYVAEYAVKKMLKGKTVIIPGINIRLGVLFSKIVPDFILARIAYNIQHKKGK